MTYLARMAERDVVVGRVATGIAEVAADRGETGIVTFSFATRRHHDGQRTADVPRVPPARRRDAVAVEAVGDGLERAALAVPRGNDPAADGRRVVYGHHRPYAGSRTARDRRARVETPTNSHKTRNVGTAPSHA